MSSIDKQSRKSGPWLAVAAVVVVVLLIGVAAITSIGSPGGTGSIKLGASGGDGRVCWVSSYVLPNLQKVPKMPEPEFAGLINVGFLNADKGVPEDVGSSVRGLKAGLLRLHRGELTLKRAQAELSGDIAAIKAYAKAHCPS